MQPVRRVEILHMHNDTKRLQDDLFIPEVRTEELPVWNLNLVDKAKAEVPFDKSKSVFKPWIKDTKASMNLALEYDVLYWKVNRLVKDPDEQVLVFKTIERYFVLFRRWGYYVAKTSG